ncbi:hypothetical protein D3C87_2030130 [compost metagenome]
MFQHELANGIGVIFDELVKQTHSCFLGDAYLVEKEVEAITTFEFHGDTWHPIVVIREEQLEVAAGVTDMFFNDVRIAPERNMR